jgi:hypothetical protein
MRPSIDQLVDAQHAIDRQHPTLDDDAAQRFEARFGALASRSLTSGASGRRVVRLTPEQLATISMALGIAHAVCMREPKAGATLPLDDFIERCKVLLCDPDLCRCQRCAERGVLLFGQRNGDPRRPYLYCVACGDVVLEALEPAKETKT